MSPFFFSLTPVTLPSQRASQEEHIRRKAHKTSLKNFLQTRNDLQEGLKTALSKTFHNIPGKRHQEKIGQEDKQQCVDRKCLDMGPHSKLVEFTEANKLLAPSGRGVVHWLEDEGPEVFQS